MKRATLFPVALVLLLGGVGQARADVLIGNFYSVPDNNATDPDFQSFAGGSTGLVQSQLGPDGLPVAAAGSGFQMVNGQGELLWWTPSAGNNSYGITFLGQQATTFPFSGTDMYVSNYPNNFSNPSANDGTNFLTVHWTGSFNAPVAGTYTFTSGSDDDTWVFIDGQLVVDNGGIHGLNVVTTSFSLPAGPHSIDIFYDDREQVDAQFALTSFLDPNGNPVGLEPPLATTVPEPATVALLGLGIAGLAGYRWRRRKHAAA